MSYLPRMSKTYKEPEEKLIDIEEDLSSGSLKPASALLNEKTFNPQMALKHYRYLPHAPPVLPGPSILDEILENELLREASRLRRSTNKTENEDSVELSTSVETSEMTTEETDPTIEAPDKMKRRKNTKGNKSTLGRRRTLKGAKRGNTSNITINTCLTLMDKPFTVSGEDRKSRTGDSGYLEKTETGLLRREKSALPILVEVIPTETEKPASKPEIPTEKREIERKKFANRSVQCTIFEKPSKVFVIPQTIHSLLRTLAFLLHEVRKEDTVWNSLGEKKFPMTQAQLTLGDLCNQKPDEDFSIDITYSDFKRLEKILGELQKYMKDIYGDRRENIDKREDLKKIYIESKTREMELDIFMEKLQEKKENPVEEVEVNEDDLKYPEITLQNKRLESEQLSAEVEFGNREIKKYQKTIAELEWEVRSCQEEIASLKKSGTSKAKPEAAGKKNSLHRFSGELVGKVSKTKHGENIKKKT